MAKVVAEMSMSLDGFIAGPGDDITQVFSWFMGGDVSVESDNPELGYETDEASAELLKERDTVGAIVNGRRTFDLAGGWNGTHPVGVPVYILTHNPPDGWDDAPFTFVTDGIESAVKQASKTAGDGMVGVSGASIVRQCMNAGLLDEVRVSLTPYVLGDGVRYFEEIEKTPVELGQPRVIEAKGVTHLHYDVR